MDSARARPRSRMPIITVQFSYSNTKKNSTYFSEENYDAFCLAYMFTYRDFEGGTLGLAWTGDLKNAGGVCEKNGVSRGKNNGNISSWCIGDVK